MKKISLSIVLLLTLMFIFIGTVNAATITTAVYKDGQITIKGTGTDSVQIVLFNKINEPIYMTTASIEDGKFNMTLPQIEGLTEGSYKIKAGDYNGAGVVEKTIEITKVIELSEQKDTTPKTGNSIFAGAIVLLVSAVGITTIKFMKNK